MKATGGVNQSPLSKSLFWPTVASLAALALLLGLGAWQWSRKAWKDELIATIAARSSAAPIGIDALLTRNCRPVDQVGLASACDYLPVRLAGQFEHAEERHVYTVIDRQAAGGGGAGFWIMTPFKLANRDLVIAVNRGFVPQSQKGPETRQQSQPTGELEVVGRVRSAEPRPTFTGANAPDSNIWYLRAPGELFATGGISPQLIGFYVELQAPVPPGSLPQPTAGRIAIPNRHLEYALTWWALGVTLIVVYAAFVWSRRDP